MNDADLENARTGVLLAKLRTPRQTCVAANRILVQSRIHDTFVQALKQKFKDLQARPWSRRLCTVGSIDQRPRRAKVSSARSRRAVQKSLARIRRRARLSAR